MKKKIYSNLMLLAVIIMTSMLSFTSCDPTDPDPDPDPILVEDGLYIKGAATAYVELNSNGRMEVTKNEVTQELRNSLYEAYVAVEAGTNGFNIVSVAGTEVKIIGPGADFAEVTELDNDEPRNGLWRGAYAETETQFTVTESGLYHVVIDTELQLVAIAKVSWGLIGAATPGGWTDDTELTEGTFDKTAISYEGTEIAMKLNEFKFRYSGGWKIILDTELDLGGGDKGVKVNTNFGGAIDALDAGGSNIAFTAPGIYTVQMTWSSEDGTSATFTKTGDLAFTDWSEIGFDVFGSGVDPDGTGAVTDPSSWAWGSSVSADAAPTVEGDVATGALFTWEWTNVALIPAENEGFAFRSVDGTEYNGNVLRYAVIDEDKSDMTAIASTTNGYGDVNFNAIAAGGFDVILTIDAADNDKATVIIVKTGAATYDMWGIIGDATPGGWDADTDMTPNEDGTVWTWTGDLTAGQFKFRANDSWDKQIGDDGNGGAEFNSNATAWVIASGEEGNYTITLNSSTPTMTITKN